MVHSIQTRGRKGSRMLSNNRAIVLHQGGQCRWAEGMQGCMIRAQQPRSKRISCKGQLAAYLTLRQSGERLPDWPLQDIRLCIQRLCTCQYYSWHSTPPLLHPPCFVIQHTMLVISISCKGQLPESRCFVEDKRPLCQLSSKRSEDNWHNGEKKAGDLWLRSLSAFN